MAHHYIDDDAWPGSTSDGPLSSAAVQLHRNNLAQIWAERRVGCGHVELDASPWRLCSVFPCAWPIGFVYVHAGEPTITATLRFSSVEWSVDTAPGSIPAPGSNAVQIALTCMATDGRGATETPGTDRTTGWTLLTTTAAEQTVTLTCPTRGYTGWVVVLLWTWSYWLDEGLADVVILDASMPGELEVADLGPIATLPPERAISCERPITPGGMGISTFRTIGGLYQVEAHQAGMLGERLIQVWPPPIYEVISYLTATSTAYYGSYPHLTWYTMGVALLSGWHVEATPDDSEIPGPWSCETASVAGEALLRGLAEAGERLVSTRVAQWSAHQTAHVVDSNLVHEHHFQGGLEDAIDYAIPAWTPIATWTVADPPPLADSQGYGAVVGVQFFHAGASQGSAIFQLRLVARQIGSAAPATYKTGIAKSWTVLPAHQHEWWPAGHGLHLSGIYHTYQHRGAMINTAVAGYGADRPSDMLSIYWSPEVELADDAAITYPCEIRLEIIPTGGTAVPEFSVVTSGLRCLDME